MITRICIENATASKYALSDQNGHQYGTIQNNGYYYLNLIYNTTTTTHFTFRGGGGSFSMWLDTDGQITRIAANDQVYLLVLSADQSPPNNINPLYNFAGWSITMGGTDSVLQSRVVHHNKLLITPINNIFARANVPVIHYNLDLS